MKFGKRQKAIGRRQEARGSSSCSGSGSGRRQEAGAVAVGKRQETRGRRQRRGSCSCSRQVAG